MDEIPRDYPTTGMFLIVSGLFNMLASLMWMVALLWIVVGVLWVIPGLVGITEVIVGTMILSGRPFIRVRYVSIAGIVAGLFNCGFVPILMESLALLWLRKPELAGWLAEQEAAELEAAGRPLLP